MVGGSILSVGGGDGLLGTQVVGARTVVGVGPNARDGYGSAKFPGGGARF